MIDQRDSLKDIGGKQTAQIRTSGAPKDEIEVEFDWLVLTFFVGVEIFASDQLLDNLQLELEKRPIADVLRVCFSSRSARSVALTPKPDAEFLTAHFLMLTQSLVNANAMSH